MDFLVFLKQCISLHIRDVTRYVCHCVMYMFKNVFYFNLESYSIVLTIYYTSYTSTYIKHSIFRDKPLRYVTCHMICCCHVLYSYVKSLNMLHHMCRVHVVVCDTCVLRTVYVTHTHILLPLCRVYVVCRELFVNRDRAKNFRIFPERFA